ncbi:MAG: gliding motility-associated C-terminal domain-containing protein [Bacteroidota bacterium]
MRFLLVILFVFSLIQLNFGQSRPKNEKNDLTDLFHVGAGCTSHTHKSTGEKEIEKRAYLAWKLRRPAQLRSANAIRTVPIVFHLIEDVPAFTDEDIRGAVASLNNAFSHSNRYAGGRDYSGDTIGVDTRIEFCLPSRAPDGGRTNGIVRWTSDYARMDKDIEDAKLKTMGQWDPRYYMNVWVVTTIENESDASYTGRTWWTRRKIAGYASLPGAVIGVDARTDGVVVSGIGPGLLAHEVGHYLNLLHTFEGGCKNDDCLADGDMVCDTPPAEESMGCNMGQNSCNTDTLSNYSNGIFTRDVTDMVTNFMDYSSCPLDFTHGQADRMHFALDNYRIDLAPLSPDRNEACITPCNDSVNVSFSISDRYFATNTPITFDASGSGIDTYEWYVERLGGTGFDYTITWEKGYTPSTAVDGTNPQFTTSMTDPGKYRIYLKAWNSSNPDCFASYSRVLRVTCGGVDARFYPDVRLIASKRDAGKMLDKVLFTNQSVNATNYDWAVGHGPYDGQLPALDTLKSTVLDLEHTFLEPGDFGISLIASDGACADTIGPYLLPVLDPTIDADIKINRVDCYKEDSIRIEFELNNKGFDTMRVGFPITFYDEDPFAASPIPNQLGTFYTDKLVYGMDQNERFVFIVPASRAKLDQIWPVVNDTGSVNFPIVWPLADENVMSVNSEFPPSGFNELTYDNNSARRRNYQFRINVGLDGTLACTAQEASLIADYDNTRQLTDVEWIPDTRVSCRDCLDPVVQLPTNDTTYLDVILTSEYFCKDTASFLLPEIGTLVGRPAVSTIPELCPGTSSLDLDTFVNGTNLTWYTGANSNDGRTATPTMSTNMSGTFSLFVTQTIDNCEGPRQELRYTIKASTTEPDILNNPILCEASVAPNITTLVTGNNIQWYDSERGGMALTNPPQINTNNPGQINFWVTQSLNGCESPRAQLPIEVRPKSAVPQVRNAPGLCPGSSTLDLNTLVTGTDILWYNQENGGTGNPQAPPGNTQNAGDFSFWVSQNTNTCESPRVEVTYSVFNSTPAPQVSTVADICAGASAPNLELAVSGLDLVWYTNDTIDSGNNNPPNVDTRQSGLYNFWVSQSIDGCESQRSRVDLTIKPLPVEPSLQGDTRFCQDSQAPSLSNYISGNNLTWYSEANGPFKIDSVPQIKTDQEGANSFWISQTVNGCEGPRAELVYEILALPSSPQLALIDKICQGTNGPNLGDFVSGNDLLWYQNAMEAIGNPITPMVNTQLIGLSSFWVSQSDANCESPKVELSYEVVAPPVAPAVTPIEDICEGDPAFDLGEKVSGERIRWYAQRDDSLAQVNIPLQNTSNAGDYTWWVSQSDEFCESQKTSLSYRVKMTPEAPSLVGDPNICRGAPAPNLANFTNGINLKWYDSAVSTNASVIPPEVNPDSSGIYSFWRSQTLNGCEGPRSELILKVIGLDVIPLGPYLVPEGTTEKIEAEVFIDPNGEPFQITWTDPNNFTLAEPSQVLEITPEDDGIYTIIATSGRCTESAEIAVEVLFELDMTKIFSPNEDGANDFWYIGDIDQFPNAEVNVFNRWGDMVYRAQPYSNNWDGRDNQGRKLPMATYYYVIKLNDNNRKPVTGSVTIKY